MCIKSIFVNMDFKNKSKVMNLLKFCEHLAPIIFGDITSFLDDPLHYFHEEVSLMDLFYFSRVSDSFM
jgi:hypothetical protein